MAIPCLFLCMFPKVVGRAGEAGVGGGWVRGWAGGGGKGGLASWVAGRVGWW